MRKRRDQKLYLPLVTSGYAPAGGGGVSYVEMSAFQPDATSQQADVNSDWTLITGLAAGIQQTTNAWYPAKIGGYTGVRWSTLPVALATNDNYMQCTLINAWTSGADYIGPAVRVSDSADTWYAFLVDGDDYILRKMVAGSQTDLKTGSLALAAGDVIRIEAIGTTISAYKNDGLVDSATDAAIASGDPGIVGAGLGSVNQITEFRAGDTPVGNVSVYGGYAPYARSGSYYSASCFSDGEDIVNGNLVTGGLSFHGPEPHYIEIDLLGLRVPSRIRSHGTTSDYYDWTDVDVLTKVESGDDWAEVATALDLDGDGVDGWKASGDFAIIQPCRYVRVEINTTLHSSNFAGSEEVEFFCTTIP